MPHVTLALLAPSDADELFAFEMENRQFFEAHINARPAEYYSRIGVRTAIEAAKRDAEKMSAYQYLVRDAQRSLVGRVNLTRIRRAHFHSAELGYRTAQAHCGRGYASEAVRQVCEMAFGSLELRRLEASTRIGNVGSIRVLATNGFVQCGHSKRSFELRGVWYDRLLFEAHAPG